MKSNPDDLHGYYIQIYLYKNCLIVSLTLQTLKLELNSSYFQLLIKQDVDTMPKPLLNFPKLFHSWVKRKTEKRRVSMYFLSVPWKSYYCIFRIGSHNQAKRFSQNTSYIHNIFYVLLCTLPGAIPADHSHLFVWKALHPLSKGVLM